MALDARLVLEMFEAAGGLLRGHFTLTSGHHSSSYVQSSQILGHPAYTEPLAADLAARFRDEQVTCVVGSAPGGAVLAYAIARRLGARAVYAERIQGIIGLARGYSLDARDRVLLVEDAVITGNSVREMLELVSIVGATAVGLGVVIDRSTGGLDFGIRTECMAAYHSELYLPDDCPLCRANVPLRRPKHGRL